MSVDCSFERQIMFLVWSWPESSYMRVTCLKDEKISSRTKNDVKLFILTQNFYLNISGMTHMNCHGIYTKFRLLEKIGTTLPCLY